ncbi:MAG: alpha/beta hydrolase [Planctomycetota bacterium]
MKHVVLASLTLLLTALLGCSSAVSVDLGNPSTPPPPIALEAMDPSDPLTAYADPTREQAESPDFWLSVAHAADKAIFEELTIGVSDRTTRLLAIQHYALARWLELKHDRLVTASGFTAKESQAESQDNYIVRIMPGDPVAGVLDPARFDRLIPAETVDVRGMQQRFARVGVGLSLVGVIDTTKQTLSDTPNLPPEGLFLPVTLTVDFARRPGGQTKARITLLDPDRVRSVRKFGVPFQLSADTTAPIAMLYAETELQREANTGLWNPTHTEARTGIYLHEPFAADKTPVLFIHGLWSSPLTWRDMLNTLRADPVLARHYQFWMFLYPTGMPIPRSSAFLRSDLAKLRAHYEADLNPESSVATQDMLVIGHSMGGLLTKTLIQGGGDTIWHAFHPEPFAEIEAPSTVKQRLAEAFFYEPDARASRAVFIATPHRGSDLADAWFTVLSRSQIEPPAVLAEVDAWIDNERQRLRKSDPPYDPEHHQILRGLPNSLENLSPRSPYLAAYNRIPIPPAVTYHSIIAEQRDLANPTSDGVVPFKSARLEGAATERIVRSGHGAVTNAQAIAEVRRILHEHLEQRGLSPETDVLRQP